MKRGIFSVFLFCLLTATMVSCVSAGPNVSQWDISEAELLSVLSSGDPYYLVDVRRSDDEYPAGHIPTAVNIPVSDLDAAIAEAELPEKDRLTIVYCAAGARARTAKSLLQEMGYTNVKNFGGFSNWSGQSVTGDDPGEFQQ